MKKIIVLLSVVITTLNTNAQDAYFSQVSCLPYIFNPAMTPLSSGNSRITLAYRTQWQPVLKESAFRTTLLSYSGIIPITRSDIVSVGGGFFADKAGKVSLLTSRLGLDISYLKRLSASRFNSDYLAAGFSLGIGNKRVEIGKMQWGSQFNPEILDFDMDWQSMENVNSNSFFFTDLSGGLMWCHEKKSGNYYISLSMNHINSPYNSFEKTDRLEPKINLQSGYEHNINNHLTMWGNLYYSIQGRYNAIHPGLGFKYNQNRATNKYIGMGLSIRITDHVSKILSPDAIIALLQVRKDKFQIGLSYDLNISELNSTVSGNGAYEISLSYLMPCKFKVECPQF